MQRLILSILFFSSIASGTATPAPATKGKSTKKPHRGANAHVHGKVEAKLAVDKSRVNLTLEAPLDDLVGFEHKPRNKEEEGKLKLALDPTTYASAFTLTQTPSSCSPPKIKVQLDGDHAKEAHGKSHHHNVHITFEWSCQTTETIKSIESTIFSLLPGTKNISFSGIWQTKSLANKAFPKSERITLNKADFS